MNLGIDQAKEARGDRRDLNEEPVERRADQRSGWLGNLGGVFVVLLIAVMPKCPLCWVSYMSFLGLSGVSSIALHKWSLPVLGALFCAHLWASAKRARQREFFLPIYLNSIGFVAIVVGYYAAIPAVRWLGIVAVLIGSMLNTLSPSALQFLRRQVARLRANR